MKSLALTYCVTFIAAVALSFLLTRYVRNLALARGWRTKQPSERDVHTAPIPRLGGVSIFASFLIATAGVLLLSRSAKPHMDVLVVFSILVPCGLIFLLGLYDDLFSAGPYVKFAVQIFAAVLVFFSGFRVISLPLLFGDRTFGTATSLLATIVWVLLITNAFNLVDGLDGLAAGSALFSTLTVVVLSVVHGRVMIAVLALALAGAILGFLRFNFNPATIFLGDCGSLLIGFLLSVLAMAGAEKSSTLVAVAIPIVSFGLPILETAISVLRRFMSGQPLFAPDRQHIHHKLLERGLSQRQAVVLLYGVSAIFGLLSAMLLYPSGPAVGVVLFVIGLGIWLGVQHLNYPEFFEIGRVATRTLEQKQVIVNNLSFRRATSRLANAQRLEDIYGVLQETFQSNDFDGFELCLKGAESSSREESRADLMFLWKKDTRGNGGFEQKAPMWTISLELVARNQVPQGSFRAYKEYGKGSLKVDLNLLIQEFQSALGEAVERARRSTERAKLPLRGLDSIPETAADHTLLD